MPAGPDAPGSGWAVPMQDVVNKAAMDRAIDTMNPIDPLSYKPALTAAYNALQHTNARITHIILLGDGDAEDSYYPDTGGRMQAPCTAQATGWGLTTRRPAVRPTDRRRR